MGDAAPRAGFYPAPWPPPRADNTPTEAVRLQVGEVDAARRATVEEIRALIASGQATDSLPEALRLVEGLLG